MSTQRPADRAAATPRLTAASTGMPDRRSGQRAMNAFSAVVASSAWVFCFVASVTKASHIQEPAALAPAGGINGCCCFRDSLGNAPEGPRHEPEGRREGTGSGAGGPRPPQLPLDPLARLGDASEARAPGRPDWGLEAYGGAAVDPETRSQAIDGPRKLASAAVRGSVGPAEPASLRRTHVDRQNGGNFDSGHASCSPASLLSKSAARASFRTRATPLEMDERFALSGAGFPSPSSPQRLNVHLKPTQKACRQAPGSRAVSSKPLAPRPMRAFWSTATIMFCHGQLQDAAGTPQEAQECAGCLRPLSGLA